MESQNINSSSTVKTSGSQPQVQKEAINTNQNIPKLSERSTAGLFITPVIQFDSAALSVIFQVRDGLSGEITQEYPQESVVKGRQDDVASSPVKGPVPSVNIEVVTAEPNAPAIKPEKASQGSNGVDLNTATAESNGSSATASTTAGIATGLGT